MEQHTLYIYISLFSHFEEEAGSATAYLYRVGHREMDGWMDGWMDW